MACKGPFGTWRWFRSFQWTQCQRWLQAALTDKNIPIDIVVGAPPSAPVIHPLAFIHIALQHADKATWHMTHKLYVLGMSQAATVMACSNAKLVLSDATCLQFCMCPVRQTKIYVYLSASILCHPVPSCSSWTSPTSSDLNDAMPLTLTNS